MLATWSLFSLRPDQIRLETTIWGWSEVTWKSLSRVRLFLTPWTIQSIEFSRPEYWSESPFPSPGDLPNPGIKPRSPALQEDSLPTEPQGKPKNTRVGSLFLLQQIFPTQESNWGLLHCRQILYQLSYEGRSNRLPIKKKSDFIWFSFAALFARKELSNTF